jgi:hypothetical protein
MLELVRNARVIWSGVAERAGLMPSGARTAAAREAGSRLVRDTPGLTQDLQELVADPERRAPASLPYGSATSDTPAACGRCRSASETPPAPESGARCGRAARADDGFRGTRLAFGKAKSSSNLEPRSRATDTAFSDAFTKTC